MTTTKEALLLTGAQVNPKADGDTEVRVELSPGQIILGVAVTVMLGPGSTVTVTNPSFVQLPDAPMTV